MASRRRFSFNGLPKAAAVSGRAIPASAKEKLWQAATETRGSESVLACNAQPDSPTRLPVAKINKAVLSMVIELPQAGVPTARNQAPPAVEEPARGRKDLCIF